MKSAWFVYIVRCCDGSLYTGMTNDVEKRVRVHNEGEGGSYTRSHRPVELVRVERVDSKGNALKREAQIKKLSKAEKEKLILS
jgi:putative endonuclease